MPPLEKISFIYESRIPARYFQKKSTVDGDISNQNKQSYRATTFTTEQVEVSELFVLISAEHTTRTFK